jgi:hypothetical protein
MKATTEYRWRAPHIKCPNCGSKCHSLGPQVIEGTYREIKYECGNQLCRMSFCASLTPFKIVRPPANNTEFMLSTKVANQSGRLVDSG